MTKLKALVINTAIAVSLIAAAAFVIQLQLWQARANGLPGASTGGMSSIIQKLQSGGHAKDLPVQVIEDLN
jgi:hypothetical protein